MLTGKQRSYLKGLANSLKPVIQIGKEGITESFITQLEETIKVRELVKITILESCDVDAKEVARELTERTGSEFVQAIGRKVTIFRIAEDEKDRKIIVPGLPRPKPVKPAEAEAPVVKDRYSDDKVGARKTFKPRSLRPGADNFRKSKSGGGKPGQKKPVKKKHSAGNPGPGKSAEGRAETVTNASARPSFKKSGPAKPKASKPGASRPGAFKSKGSKSRGRG
jgi:RNA-binding protein